MAIREGHEACANCRRELTPRRDGKGYKHTYAKDKKYCKNPVPSGKTGPLGLGILPTVHW